MVVLRRPNAIRVCVVESPLGGLFANVKVQCAGFEMFPKIKAHGVAALAVALFDDRQEAVLQWELVDGRMVTVMVNGRSEPGGSTLWGGTCGHPVSFASGVGRKKGWAT